MSNPGAGGVEVANVWPGGPFWGGGFARVGVQVSLPPFSEFLRYPDFVDATVLPNFNVLFGTALSREWAE